MTTTRAPVPITGATRSHDNQIAARKRKYLLMTSCQIPCLMLAREGVE